jgi:hypothetical protein
VLGGIWGYVRVAGAVGTLYLPGIGSFEFRAGGGHVEGRPDPDVAEALFDDAYRRHVLPMVLHFRGLQVLHGSAVGSASGVHVFCGSSHAGKSTLAYALQRRGYQVWADDAVALTSRGETVCAVALPFALRVRPEAAAFFAQPAVAAAVCGVEMLRPADIEQTVGELAPIASVSVLEHAPSMLSRIPPSESLPAILNHAFHFSLDDEASRRRLATDFLRLISQVPLFRLCLPRGLDQLNGALDEVETRVFGPAASSRWYGARLPRPD